MRKPIKILLFALFISCNTGLLPKEENLPIENKTAQVEAQAPSSSEEIAEEQKILIAKLLDKAREQANMLGFSLQQMQQIIANNQLQMPKEATEELLAHLAVIFQSTLQQTGSLLVVPDPQAIMVALCLNHAIMQYLLLTPIQLINATEFGSYVQSQVPALQSALSSEEELVAFADTTSEKLKELTYKADNLGLSSINKFFKWFFDAPAVKLSKYTDGIIDDTTPWGLISNATKWGLIAGIGATLFVFNQRESNINKITKWFSWIPGINKLKDFKKWTGKTYNHAVAQSQAELKKIQIKEAELKLTEAKLKVQSLNSDGVTLAKTMIDSNVGNIQELEASIARLQEQSIDPRRIYDDPRPEATLRPMENLELILKDTYVNFTLMPAFTVPLLTLLFNHEIFIEYGAPVKVKEKYDAFMQWPKVQKLTLKWANFIHRLKGNYSTKIKASNNPYAGDAPDVPITDIIGRPDLHQLAKEIKDYLENPDRYERTNTPPPLGILLVGPPQTGKSFFAKALRSYLNQGHDPNTVKFLSVSKTEITAWGGIHVVFKVAQYLAPCVLFLDEIDMLDVSRAKDGKTTSDLLTAMSGLDASNSGKRVIVLAATNKPDELDHALPVDGRFGKQIPFDYPSYENRVEALQRGFASRHIIIVDLNEQEQDRLIKQIARQTHGASYNNLESIIKAALRTAMSEMRMVTKKDFELAVDTEIRNITPSINISKSEEKVAAIYHAGKALSYLLLKPTDIIVKVTTYPIRKKINAVKTNFKMGLTNDESENQKLMVKDFAPVVIKQGGVFTCSTNNTENFLSNKEQLDDCMIALAGRASLELVTNMNYSSFYKEDRAFVMDTLKAQISQGNAHTPAIDQEAMALQEKLYGQIKALLEPYTAAIAAIAQELAQNHSLNEQEFNLLLKKHNVKALMQAQQAAQASAAPAA